MTHAEASRRSGRLAGMKTGVGNNSKGKSQEHLVTHLTPKTLPWSSKPRLPVLTVTTRITQWFLLYRPQAGGEPETPPVGIRVPGWKDTCLKARETHRGGWRGSASRTSHTPGHLALPVATEPVGSIRRATCSSADTNSVAALARGPGSSLGTLTPAFVNKY